MQDYHAALGETAPDNPLTQANLYFDKAAAQKHGDACRRRGENHYNGIGGTPNYAEALKMFKAAEDQGLVDEEMFYKMGLIFEDHHAALGETAPDNPLTQANLYFDKAAAQNHGDACRRRGENHYNGIGGTPNYAEAFKMFKAAEDLGINDPKMFASMGHIYRFALGTPMDRAKSDLYLEKGTAPAVSHQFVNDKDHALGLALKKGWHVKENPKKKRIRSIMIRAGGVIDEIKFSCTEDDISPSSGRGGNLLQIKLDPDEYLKGLTGTFGHGVIQTLTIHTSKDRAGPVMHGGGERKRKGETPFSLMAKDNEEIVSVFTRDGKADDWKTDMCKSVGIETIRAKE